MYEARLHVLSWTSTRSNPIMIVKGEHQRTQQEHDEYVCTATHRARHSHRSLVARLGLRLDGLRLGLDDGLRRFGLMK